MEHLRTKGRQALLTLLSETNTDILEKHIWKQCKNEPTIYTWILYQTIGDISTKLEKRNVILERIKKGEIGWLHPVYNRIRARISEHDEYLIKPFDVEEGVVTCPKCHSQRVFSFSKQVRSADEPMTTFSRCAKCEYNWSYSG